MGELTAPIDEREIVCGFLDWNRSVVANKARGLDHVGVVPNWAFGPVTLRWILVHMIDETARHLGHLDVLRELTDGSIGDG